MSTAGLVTTLLAFHPRMKRFLKLLATESETWINSWFRWSMVLPLLPLASWGQTGNPEEDIDSFAEEQRPKIGLVLAGGGARGIGHVGVIQLLEELNIQVDYVAGTSMGSIIGGLYSAGYTSDEMIEWLEQCDWNLLLSDSLPRQLRGFRAKEEELDTPRWIEFGVGSSGLKVPNAFISGQNLLVALRELTYFAGNLESFDQLPIPFRAVATNVETGEMVVLDHGYLADAMRASMAVPGAFAPYELEGKVLIDGFASRNLPIDVVREMGADIVIAVDVREELLKADELTSPVSMAGQLLSILSSRDTIAQIATLGDEDVLVRLKLPGYAASSFPEALAIAALGYDEAQDARTNLTRFTISPDAYATREAARRRLQRNPPVIAAVEIKNAGNVSEKTIRDRLDIQTGEVLDPENLKDSLGRVHDLGYFKSVDYTIDNRPEGSVLVVETEHKPWGPNFLTFGIGLESDLDGSSEINIRTSTRFTQINRLGAEIAAKTSLGTEDRLDLEFFQPVDNKGSFFIAPSMEYLRTPQAFLVDFDPVFEGVRSQEVKFQRQTLFGGIAGGFRIGTYGEFRVGAERGTVDNSQIRAPSLIVVGPDGEIEVVDLGSVILDYTTNRVYGSLTLDLLDDAFFPKHGYYFKGSIDEESGPYGTTTTSLRLTTPYSFGSFVVQPILSADYTLKETDLLARLPFRVGGLFNLSGVPSDELYGANAFVGGLIFRKALGGGSENSGLFVGGSIEMGNTWDETDKYLPDNWIVAGSLFVAAKSPLGPIHMALGLAEDRDPTFYFTLGRVIP